MTQLEINITFKNAKMRVELNQMRRDDANEMELEVIRNLETLFLEVLKHVAKDSGLKVNVSKIEAKP